MSQLTKAFINEKGNPIVVAIEDALDGELTIAMEGPTTLSENTITLKEAQVLHGLLGRYLSLRRFLD